MAAEALKRAAATMGHEIRVETQGSLGTKEPLTDREIAAADVVLLAADIHVAMARFAGKPVHSVSTAEAIRNSKAVIEAALALAPEESVASIQPAASVRTLPPKTSATATPAIVSLGGKRLVGITSCPTGIAHTFMAAEALQKAAKALGHTIKVETQGSVGAKNQLTPEEIAAADAVIIAADTKVDTSRFAGKPIYSTSTKQAMHSGKEVIVAALVQPVSGAAMSLSGWSSMRKRSAPSPDRPVQTSP